MAKLHYEQYEFRRRGIADIWNAFMLDGASYDVRDIPFCPTTAKRIPRRLISWPEAKRLHKKAIQRGDKGYHESAFVHFYVDDVKFDGQRSSVWLFPWKAYGVIKHFDGVITPDFSLCQDFPEPLKVFAIYRMRAFGYWLGNIGVEVINNVRWGTCETWDYCFAGIRKHSVVAVGSVASGLRQIKNRSLFEEGLLEMVARLKPAAVIVYGSSKYDCFSKVRNMGVQIFQFDSETSIAYAGRGRHEQV